MSDQVMKDAPSAVSPPVGNQPTQRPKARVPRSEAAKQAFKDFTNQHNQLQKDISKKLEELIPAKIRDEAKALPGSTRELTRILNAATLYVEHLQNSESEEKQAVKTPTVVQAGAPIGYPPGQVPQSANWGKRVDDSVPAAPASSLEPHDKYLRQAMESFLALMKDETTMTQGEPSQLNLVRLNTINDFIVHIVEDMKQGSGP